MQYGQGGDRYVLRLDPDDIIGPVLERFCGQNGIANAVVTGIGSVVDPTLAHYRRDTKRFSEKRFDGIYEIAALTGNVSLIDGQPSAHLHAVISDEQMTAWGGHVVEAKVSATAELIVTPLPTRFTKAMDQSVGLKLWQFDEA